VAVEQVNDIARVGVVDESVDAEDRRGALVLDVVRRRVGEAEQEREAGIGTGVQRAEAVDVDRYLMIGLVSVMVSIRVAEAIPRAFPLPVGPLIWAWAPARSWPLLPFAEAKLLTRRSVPAKAQFDGGVGPKQELSPPAAMSEYLISSVA
jgi:hypothetical protein